MRLVVDALYAARLGGIKLDLEQMVFDRCVARAGGMSHLEKLLSPSLFYKKDTGESPDGK